MWSDNKIAQERRVCTGCSQATEFVVMGELPQTGLVRSFDEKAPVNWRIRQLCKSQYGLLRAIAALLQIAKGRSSPMSFEEAFAYLPKLLALHHDPSEWEEAIARRVAAFGLGRW
jgi:hypothetical protein